MACSLLSVHFSAATYTATKNYRSQRETSFILVGLQRNERCFSSLVATIFETVGHVKESSSTNRERNAISFQRLLPEKRFEGQSLREESLFYWPATKRRFAP